MLEGATICPRPLWSSPFDFESDVRVTCDVGYLCANFSLPRPLCSQLRPDVCNRQTSDRQTLLDVPPRGQEHNNANINNCQLLINWLLVFGNYCGLGQVSGRKTLGNCWRRMLTGIFPVKTQFQARCPSCHPIKNVKAVKRQLSTIKTGLCTLFSGRWCGSGHGRSWSQVGWSLGPQLTVTQWLVSGMWDMAVYRRHQSSTFRLPPGIRVQLLGNTATPCNNRTSPVVFQDFPRPFVVFSTTFKNLGRSITGSIF